MPRNWTVPIAPGFSRETGWEMAKLRETGTKTTGKSIQEFANVGMSQNAN